eukprot:5354534-Prymnesium_polylepis.1
MQVLRRCAHAATVNLVFRREKSQSDGTRVGAYEDFWGVWGLGVGGAWGENTNPPGGDANT